MKKLVLIVSLLFIASLCFGQNLALNPGFENWTVNGASGPPDDWSLSSGSMTATQEATTIHGGTYSANVTWTTTSTVYLQQFIAVTAGTNYQFAFWVYDNDQYGRARCYIRWYDSEGIMVTPSYEGSYTTDSSEWQQLDSGAQVAPATAVSAHIEVRVYDISGWPGTATVYVDDVSFLAISGNTINYAYAISGDELEVVYVGDVTSVNPEDFELTGSATITFTTAIIDGTNAKLIHLSGASTPMADDYTLDTISDGAKSTYDFYAGITSFTYTNEANYPNIIDNTHFATFKGIVSANNEDNKVWVSNASEAYNGVLVFDYSFDGLVDIGDEIMFIAIRSEYYNQTELTVPSLISIISSGNTPYGPDLIDGSDINEDIPADTNPAEKWEGQLVKIDNFYVVSFDSYNYRCLWSDGGKTDYYFLVDNEAAPSGYTLNIGSTYQEIIGVVDFNYGHYHINPRGDSDICTIPPQNVTTAIVGNDVVLTWSPGIAKTTFNVYRCSDPYGTFVKINTSPVTETTYTDVGAATTETKYFYYITEE